jgi:hypothetical protein
MSEIEALAGALVSLGCPREKAIEMAGQLDKRARQLSSEKGRTYEEALSHLLKLFQQAKANSSVDQR